MPELDEGAPENSRMVGGSYAWIDETAETLHIPLDLDDNK